MRVVPVDPKKKREKTLSRKKNAYCTTRGHGIRSVDTTIHLGSDLSTRPRLTRDPSKLNKAPRQSRPWISDLSIFEFLGTGDEEVHTEYSSNLMQ